MDTSSAGIIYTRYIFTDNGTAAIYVTSVPGLFSGNTGSGNALNAIVIGNGGIIGFGVTTLSANSLPYLVQGIANVSASSTLVIGEGVVIKGHDNTANLGGRIVVKPGASII